jgi:RhoGEF domain
MWALAKNKNHSKIEKKKKNIEKKKLLFCFVRAMNSKSVAKEAAKMARKRDEMLTPSQKTKRKLLFGKRPKTRFSSASPSSSPTTSMTSLASTPLSSSYNNNSSGGGNNVLSSDFASPSSSNSSNSTNLLGLNRNARKRVDESSVSSAIECIQRCDRTQRNNIVLEILETERLYVDNVKKLIKVYKVPLTYNAGNKDTEIVPHATLAIVFSNIEVIWEFQKEFLEALKVVVVDMGKRAQRKFDSNAAGEAGDNDNDNDDDDDDDIALIGPVFLEMAPFLKLYKVYSENYPQAIAAIESLEATNERFAEFHTSRRSMVIKGRNMLDLPSLLIQPIQRIPRYSLLLADLIKRTDCEHADRANLERALELVSAVADEVNNVIKDSENARRMIQLQKRFAGHVSFVEPTRRLVAELKCGLVMHKKEKKIHGIFVLFNDLIVVGVRTLVMKSFGAFTVACELPLERANIVASGAAAATLEGIDDDGSPFQHRIIGEAADIATLLEQFRTCVAECENVRRLNEQRLIQLSSQQRRPSPASTSSLSPSPSPTPSQRDRSALANALNTSSSSSSASSSSSSSSGWTVAASRPRAGRSLQRPIQHHRASQHSSTPVLASSSPTLSSSSSTTAALVTSRPLPSTATACASPPPPRPSPHKSPEPPYASPPPPRPQQKQRMAAPTVVSPPPRRPLPQPRPEASLSPPPGSRPLPMPGAAANQRRPLPSHQQQQRTLPPARPHRERRPTKDRFDLAIPEATRRRKVDSGSLIL